MNVTRSFPLRSTLQVPTQSGCTPVNTLIHVLRRFSIICEFPPSSPKRYKHTLLQGDVCVCVSFQVLVGRWFGWVCAQRHVCPSPPIRWQTHIYPRSFSALQLKVEQIYKNAPQLWHRSQKISGAVPTSVAAGSHESKMPPTEAALMSREIKVKVCTSIQGACVCVN